MNIFVHPFLCTDYGDLIHDPWIASARRKDRGTDTRSKAGKFTFLNATPRRSIPRAPAKQDKMKLTD